MIPVLILILTGCSFVWIGAIAAVGSTGVYIAMDREVTVDYEDPFENVWKACERTVADLRGAEVEPYKDVGEGKITAIINEQEVTIHAIYKAKNLTTVSVSAGLLGDMNAARLIHDHIGKNMPKE